MNKVTLRELEKNDISLINVWRNDPEIIDLLGANYIFVGVDIDERWFDSYLSNRDRAVRLAILESATNVHIGNVNFTSIHSTNRSAEFSIFIGNKNYWSSGYGFETTIIMLKHGFYNLNLHRIYLTLLKSNERAFKMYQRVGFREEGCHKEAVFKNGIYHDVLEMGILVSEFKL